MVNTNIVTVSDDRFGRKDGKYSQTQDKIEALFKNNYSFGINKVHSYKWKDIVQTEFYRSNKAMLDNPDPCMNGRAYKPFAIRETFLTLNEGDFLIYVDSSPEMWSTFSGITILDSLRYDLNIAKDLCRRNGGILSIHVKWDGEKHLKNGQVGKHTHANFTLDRCINTMGCQQYRSSLQHASGMFVVEISKKSRDFVDEWFCYNQMPECASLGPATEDSTKYANHSYWVAEDKIKIGHRHDQSISGLLINKMNNDLVEIPEDTNGIHGYNFLNFCKKNTKYTFINSNTIDNS